MDIKDKLKAIKREREARSKSKIIQDAWKNLEKDDELSTKEKLQQLINLTREEKHPRPKMPEIEPLPREPIQFFENSYPLGVKYGKVNLSSGLKINGDILSCLSKDPAFKELDLSSALFIDLETTGLSGGVGVVPFLVGMGYYREEKFNVVQYFLGELAEEAQMIQEIAQFFSDMNFQSVVTFNGKTFDMPLLETRFILHRQPFPLDGLPHLDFLYSARSLWRHKHESCRLCHLAREVVEADRSEDIPSAEIPWRYFQFLQTGNFELIEPILYHNGEDILSLLGVVIMGAQIFSEDEEICLADAMDFFGAGKIMEKVGDQQKSVLFFQRALNGRLTDEVSLEARKKLSLYFKRNGEWEKAVPLWQEMASAQKTSIHQLFSCRELAMYFEHQLKKYEEAAKIAEEGLVSSFGLSSFYEMEFRHRLERLKQKIKRSQEKKTEEKL